MIADQEETVEIRSLEDARDAAQLQEMNIEQAIRANKVLSFDDDLMVDGWTQDPDFSPYFHTVAQAFLHIKEDPLELDPDLQGQQAKDAGYVGILRMKMPVGTEGSLWELIWNFTPEWSGKIPPNSIEVRWNNRWVACLSPWQKQRVCPECKMPIVTPGWACKPKTPQWCNWRCPFCRTRAWKEFIPGDPDRVTPPQLLRDCAEYVAHVTDREEIVEQMGGELAKHDPLDAPVSAGVRETAEESTP